MVYKLGPRFGLCSGCYLGTAMGSRLSAGYRASTCTPRQGFVTPAFVSLHHLFIFSNSTHPLFPFWGSGEFQDDDYRWKYPDGLTCRGFAVHLGTHPVPIFSQSGCCWCRSRHLSPVGVVVFRNDDTPQHLGGVSLPNPIFGAYSLSRHLADEHYL